MKIRWLGLARLELKKIHAYIAQDSPSYADQLFLNILHNVEYLGEFPRLGRIVPEYSDKNIRELIYFPYRIIYRATPSPIDVLTVLHGSRDLLRTFPAPWHIR